MRPPITSLEDALRFADWCVDRVGPGYSPDADAADYLASDGSGLPMFDASEAADLDARHGEIRQLGLTDEVRRRALWQGQRRAGNNPPQPQPGVGRATHVDPDRVLAALLALDPRDADAVLSRFFGLRRL